MKPDEPYRPDPERASCPSILELLDRHLSRELEPAEHAVVEAHLATCPSCSEELAASRRVRDALRAAVARTPVPDGLADSIRRQRGGAGSARRPALRWVYATAATLAVAFGAWLVLRDTSIAPEITEGMTPEQVQLATVLSIGLTDHIRCAVDAGFGDEIFSHAEIIEELDERYAGLAAIVRTAAPEYRLTVGHRCSFGGREYVHLILRKGPSVISLAITAKRPDDVLPDPGLAATAAKGIPIHAARLRGYEVAGFESAGRLVFAISDLPGADHRALASALAAPVAGFLRGVPA